MRAHSCNVSIKQTWQLQAVISVSAHLFTYLGIKKYIYIDLPLVSNPFQTCWQDLRDLSRPQCGVVWMHH